MDLEEAIAKELYNQFRGDDNLDDLPEWEDAPAWDGWEDERDADYNVIPFDIHEHYKEMARRVLAVQSEWSKEQWEAEQYRLKHEHDNCKKGEDCLVSPYQCHCSYGNRYEFKEFGAAPHAHTHK